MLKILNLTDKLIWGFSCLGIILAFVFSSNSHFPSLIVSLIGVTSLIYTAKCHVFGLILMLFFSVIYGVISFNFSYYGEVATYVGMTAPMTAFSIYTWLKNPYKDEKSEVKIQTITKKKIALALIFSVIVAFIFYYILDYFNTNSLMLSTLSVFTSFFAVYLTCLRSRLYALAYALNDIVLIIMWSIASLTDSAYITMVMCFTLFLFNDLYGFYSWSKIRKKQLNNM